MASNVRLILKTFSYFGTMPVKNISFLSEHVNTMSNKYKRLLCTRPQSIFISTTSKAQQFQLCCTSNNRKAIQFNPNLFGIKNSLESTMSTRSLSSIPNEGM